MQRSPDFYTFAIGCWFVYAAFVLIVLAVLGFIAFHFLLKVW